MILVYVLNFDVEMYIVKRWFVLLAANVWSLIADGEYLSRWAVGVTSSE
jgi:hypothetical protein